jgi:formylmethanofuran dehydrogenase subunit E
MELREEEVVELAEKLHGHLAPGIALGIRMATLALQKLNTKRGSKKLIAISETARCLADGMQAATGATLGHGNAFIENYGKLALTVGRVDTMQGYRVALRRDAWKHSALMKKWMLREGRLTREEEKELARALLELSEEYLEIIPVKIELTSLFENSSIVRCSRCGELVPESLSVGENGTRVCRSCAGVGYYRIAQHALS